MSRHTPASHEADHLSIAHSGKSGYKWGTTVHVAFHFIKRGKYTLEQ